MPDLWFHGFVVGVLVLASSVYLIIDRLTFVLNSIMWLVL